VENPTFIPLLKKAVEGRESLFDTAHLSAFRLFNGFSEGNPELVIDVYASTLVFYNYAEHASQGISLVREAQTLLRNELSWIHAGVLKIRNERALAQRRGQLLFGDKADRMIQEHGVSYAIDLTMHRDASFYLDTRNLRRWLLEHMGGKSILNTFAYTGSLGVVAIAGGASRVVQLDLNKQFLNLAKDSYALNGFPIFNDDFIAADFFPAIGRLKRAGERFDCVLIDPPFFSTTSKGKVDQVNESARLINKVRPLINDGGWLVAINNALFVSGQQYMQTLESLCQDGYLEIKELIPVPEDIVGYNRVSIPVTDPSPFNHSTKIAILDVKRKA
jgi:23S rRNA (cytosine1962-C5)-methyltransferase